MRRYCLALGFAVSLAACAPTKAVFTPVPTFATATVPPSAAVSSTPAPTIEQIPATEIPVSGTTTTQLNVRLDPLSWSTPLGVIPASTTVQIMGMDPGGNWYQIIFEGGELRKAWVSAEYVSVADKSRVRVVGGNEQVMASVREQINVRKGPGLEFESVGLLSPRDAVWLIGRDGSGAWLQIVFPSSADGTGWTAASFLENAATEGLPIIAESGEVMGTSTPTGTPPIPTPTIGVAAADGDARESPAADVTFGPSGTGALIYSSDLSAPDGDAEDWIRFTPYRDSIRLALECRGSARVRTLLQQDGGDSTPVEGPGCGESIQLRLAEAGVPYILNISVAAPQNGRTYANFDLKVDNSR